MGVISWQPVLLININLWKSTSPLVPYLGPRLPRPLHYSEPMGHLMNLIFKPLMFCEVWSVPLQSLKGTFLTALPWGHCCLLQGVLSPRWSNPQASFTCFAGIHIALAVRGTIWCCSCPSGSWLEWGRRTLGRVTLQALWIVLGKASILSSHIK